MSQYSAWRSLRIKIVAWSFIPTLIILSAVAVIIFVAYRQVTTDLVVERNRELARLTAGQLSSALTEYGQTLATEARALAQLPGAEDYADALLARRNRLVIFDGGVLAFDRYGRVVAAVPARADALGQDWSDRAYFADLLHAASGVVISDIVEDGPEGVPVVAVAVPITNAQGELVGGLAGMFRVGQQSVSAFYGEITKLRLGQTSSAYLVDGNRRVIYQSAGQGVGQAVGENDIVDEVLAGQVNTQRARDADGTWILASFAPVPGTAWGLVSQESWGELMSSGQEYGRFLLVLLALGVVLPLGAVIVGVRRITAPLWGLIHAAQDVAHGNFDHTIRTGTHDEIAELATQFNAMAAQLRNSYAELEQRVADRTRELAALNAIAGVVSRSLDLHDILNDALAKTLEVINLQAGGIHLVDVDGGALRLAVSVGLDAGWLAETGSLERFEDLPEQMVRLGQSYATGDVSTDSEVIRDFLAATGYRALASVPLRSKGQVRGVLFGLSLLPRTFSEAELELLTSIGDQIGVAVDNARLFAAESRRRQEASVLAGMARLISSTLDLDQVLRLTAEYAVDIFKADHCLICLYDRAAGPLRCVVEAGIDGEAAARVHLREMSLAPDVAQTVLETLRPLVIEDGMAGPGPDALGWGDLDVGSALLVPIEVRGRRLGLLQLGTRRPARRRFSADEAELALAMANQAAMAIDNARYYRDQQRRAEQFRIINEVSGRITSVLDTDDLLETVVRQIKDTFDYYNVNIFMVDATGQELVLKAGLRGEGDQEMVEEHRLRIGSEGILGHAAATGRPVLVDDVSQDSRYRALPSLPDTRSELGVPIKVRDRLIGVLDVQSTELHGFDRGDLITLQTLADQIGIAMENARLFASAEQAAAAAERQRLARDLHDAVTQTLFSATLIAEVLPRIWQRSAEQGLARLEELRQLTRGALAEMRTLLLELRPAALVEAPLPELLRQLCEATTGRSRVPVALEISGDPECAVPADVKVAFYRIAQEALNNVAKHSGATAARVALRCGPHELLLVVADGGRGFDRGQVPLNHLGLGIMEERAQGIGAELHIASQAGQGTEVTVIWRGPERSNHS